MVLRIDLNHLMIPGVNFSDFRFFNDIGSFIVHCIAGGAAGIVEHTATFPFDTGKSILMPKLCAFISLDKL